MTSGRRVGGSTSPSALSCRIQIVKLLDRMLQQQRIKRVRHHVRSEDTVLDFGCFDGQLFKTLGHLMAGGPRNDDDVFNTFRRRT